MSKTTPNLGLFQYDPSTDGAQTFNVQQALNDNWDKIDANVLQSLATAAPYSASKTYALGAYCTRGGRLYKCTTAITAAETWTAAHWTETTLTAELLAHISNKSNPHGVTKAQVGLGNVPNVATNDQTPTYTQASTLAALASGEKLSAAFAKIAKAVADLISHLANKSNPHGVTAAQAGAVPKTGGTMTGNLVIKKETPLLTGINTTTNEDGMFYVYANGVTLQSRNVNGDDKNRRMLRVLNSANQSDLNYALQLQDIVNGSTAANRVILHSGNVGNYALPISGGNVTGGLGASGGKAVLSGYTDTNNSLCQLQALKDKDNAALLQIERPLDNVNDPVVSLYQRKGGGSFGLVGQMLHTGNKSKLFATGSYVGTGVYGADNPNGITLPFPPKLVVVKRDNTPNSYTYLEPEDFMIYVSGDKTDRMNNSTGTSQKKRYYNRENPMPGVYYLFWYCDLSSEKQMNKEGETYRYVAIG